MPRRRNHVEQSLDAAAVISHARKEIATRAAEVQTGRIGAGYAPSGASVLNL